MCGSTTKGTAFSLNAFGVVALEGEENSFTGEICQLDYYDYDFTDDAIRDYFTAYEVAWSSRLLVRIIVFRNTKCLVSLVL